MRLSAKDYLKIQTLPKSQQEKFLLKLESESNKKQSSKNSFKLSGSKQDIKSKSVLCPSNLPEFHQVFCVKLPFRALVKQRARFSPKGAVFTPEQTRKYEKLIKTETQKAMLELGLIPFQYPVEIRAIFAFKGDKKMLPTYGKVGDLSNLLKAIEDGMNDVVYLDDRLIVKAEAIKKFDEEEHIIIEVRSCHSMPSLL